mmetsp:Transcript_2187/g.6493  ORF Transcript_2187/g.6493 Transcript_2187/m.6493 type:complete len:241 (+) Transcript_2187:587-1309(+)
MRRKSGPVKRRSSTRVARFDEFFRVGVEKERLQRVGPREGAREVQRRGAPSLFLGVRVRAGGQQQLRRLRVAAQASAVQRRAAQRVGLVDGSALSQQNFHQFVAVLRARSDQQWRQSLSVSRVDVRSVRLQAPPQRRHVSLHHRLEHAPAALLLWNCGVVLLLRKAREPLLLLLLCRQLLRLRRRRRSHALAPHERTRRRDRHRGRQPPQHHRRPRHLSMIGAFLRVRRLCVRQMLVGGA